MKRAFWVALTIFLLGTSLASAQPRQGAKDFATLMMLGQTALNMEDFANARVSLEEAVALRPDDPAAHYALGRAYAGEKRYQVATEHFLETLELSPDHASALVDLAAIEENTGRFEQAAEHYRQALAQGPNPGAQRGLASLLAKQGKQDEAVKMLIELAEADVQDAKSRYQLGLVLMQAGDCEGAVGQFQAVSKIDTTHTGALMNLGNCLNRLGRTEEAQQAMERFRATREEEREKTDIQRRGYFLLVEADKKLQQGDLTGAMSHMDEAVRLNPDDPRAHAMRGQTFEAQGAIAKALQDYVRAAELDPSDPVVLVEAGRLLGKTGRLEEAVPYFKKALELDPKMPEAHFMLAAAYFQLGRTEEAGREKAIYDRLMAGRERPAPPQ